MPADVPDAAALVEIVAEEISSRLRPALSGRLAFEAAMSAGLLQIAARELALAPAAREAEHARLRELCGRDGTLAELEAQLVQRIRDGVPVGPERDAVLAHLRATSADRLAVVNPGYA